MSNDKSVSELTKEALGTVIDRGPIVRSIFRRPAVTNYAVALAVEDMQYALNSVLTDMIKQYNAM